jgi:hypothetical protein
VGGLAYCSPRTNSSDKKLLLICSQGGGPELWHGSVRTTTGGSCNQKARYGAKSPESYDVPEEVRWCLNKTTEPTVTEEDLTTMPSYWELADPQKRS